jgi:hypothetical protein
MHSTIDLNCGAVVKGSSPAAMVATVRPTSSDLHQRLMK